MGFLTPTTDLTLKDIKVAFNCVRYENAIVELHGVAINVLSAEGSEQLLIKIKDKIVELRIPTLILNLCDHKL